MIDKIKERYKIEKLSIELEQVLSDNYIVGPNKRKLTKEDIFMANEELGVDFQAYGLIPIIDIYDNDFICYQIHNNKWCVFNIVDEMSFCKDSSLSNLIKFKE